MIPPRSHAGSYRRLNQRVQDRMDESRDAIRSRRGAPSEVPGEALACPRCRTTFDAGSLCPSCDVSLVGESVVHLFRPEAPKETGRTSLWLGLLAVGVGLLVSWIALS